MLRLTTSFLSFCKGGKIQRFILWNNYLRFHSINCGIDRCGQSAYSWSIFCGRDARPRQWRISAILLCLSQWQRLYTSSSGSQVAVSLVGAASKIKHPAQLYVLKRPLNIRCRGCSIAISIIVSRLRSSQWNPFLVLRSSLHPERVSSSTPALCLPGHLLHTQPRNSHEARSAVVREQTGYRTTVSLGREHLIIAKMHERDLRNVFVRHTRHLGATVPPSSPFCRHGTRLRWKPEMRKKKKWKPHKNTSFSTMQSEKEGHVRIQNSRSLYLLFEEIEFRICTRVSMRKLRLGSCTKIH